MKNIIRMIFAGLCLTFIPLPSSAFEVTGQTNVCGTSGLQLYKLQGVPIIPGTLSITYSWTVTNGACAYDCDASQEWIDWNEVCGSGSISATCTITYMTSSGNIMTSTSTTQPLEVNIKMPVASASISGPAVILCNNTSEVTYSASSTCATYFQWSVPSEWEIVSGQGTSSIRVKPDEITEGDVSVIAKTVDACGTSSASYDFPVTRNCPDDKTFRFGSNDLPENTAVNQAIIVNSGSGLIEVPANDLVRFKAGKSISINPRFRVQHGALFSAKIGPCTSCVAIKPVIDDFEFLEEIPIQNNSRSLSLKICPNPTTETFVINTENNNDLSDDEELLVTLYSMSGELLKSESIIMHENVPIDIGDLPNGIYVVILKTMYGEQYYAKVVKIE